MKRTFASTHDATTTMGGGCSTTPTRHPRVSKQARRRSGGSSVGQAQTQARGQRQLSLHAFLTVPTPQTKETPTLLLPSSKRHAGASRTMETDNSGDWPTSAQRAFEAFKLGTPSIQDSFRPALEPVKPAEGPHTLAGVLSRPSSAESSEDGFKLFCSQTYQRQSSQETDPGEEEKTSDQSEDEEGYQRVSFAGDAGWGGVRGSGMQTHFPMAFEPSHHHMPTQRAHRQEQQPAAAPQAPTNFSDLMFLDEEQPTTQPTQEPTHHEDETCCLASIMQNQGANNATTPELVPTQVHASCSTAEVGTKQDNTHGQAHVDAPLFNIFRPAKDRKCLLIVRHGESEYNRACTESKSYADPHIFDPQLTAKGHHQCIELKRRLQQLISEKLPKYGDPLFVVSPLTRSLQTFMESNPFPERLVDGNADASTSQQQQHPPLNIQVMPAISEFMVTPGDIGRPPEQLAQEFPQLAEQLLQLPPVWWYQDPQQPNCAISQSWGSSEPQKAREHRISEFARWLNGRTEQLVVMVGHSSFWHHFTNRSRARLQNCEVMSMTW